MKLSTLNAALKGELHGSGDFNFTNIKHITTAQSNELSFILESKFDSYSKTTNAGAIITYRFFSEIKNQIVVKDSREALAIVLHTFFNNPVSFSLREEETHDTLKYTNCSISNSSIIGADVSIFPGVVIGDNCKIGKNSILHPNVVLYNNCEIGNNVIIHANTTIGSDGFGYYNKNKKWGKVPQVGKVIIEDNVEIGANCTIDRGCIGNTVIGSGTKIDNLVHIAHNTHIGNDCIITAQCGTAGSAELGNNVTVGGQSGISNIKVGSNVIIASRSGVTKNIPDNLFISGFPAWEHKNELKKEAWLRIISQKGKR